MRPSEIIAARENLGLTQEEVAARARVSEQTVSRIERGIRVRANSLKDVYAVLGLAYEPMDTTVLLMPDRLLEDPATKRMQQAAATLPNVAYLIRLDPQAWARHVKDRLRRRPIRTVLADDHFGPLLVLVPLGIALAVFAACTAFSNFENAPSAAIYVGLIWGFLALIDAAICALLVWFAYDELHLCTDTPRGYAVSDDAVWQMWVDADRVRIQRTSLIDATHRAILEDGPFITIRVYVDEGVMEIPRIARHDGLVALIERTRPEDRDRTFVFPDRTSAAT